MSETAKLCSNYSPVVKSSFKAGVYIIILLIFFQDYNTTDRSTVSEVSQGPLVINMATEIKDIQYTKTRLLSIHLHGMILINIKKLNCTVLLA